MDLRIPGSEISSVAKTYKTEAAKTSQTGAAKSGAPGAADSVVVSSDAEQTLSVANAAEAKAKELPDIRDQVVDPLQAQVQSGQYQVDPEKVAGSMLAEIMSRSSEE